MALVGVVMVAEVFDEEIGGSEIVDALGGEERRETVLPKEMDAPDLALGLGSGSAVQRDAVELERPAELGERILGVGEEEAVVIHV